MGAIADTHHIVITGASGGIGVAICDAFEPDGIRITVMGRDLEALRALASHHPRSHVETCDVTNENAVEAAFAGCRHAFGPPTILINCAGTVTSGPFTKLTLKTLWETVNVNLAGTFLCSQQVLPEMLKNGSGRIINVASSAGLTGYPYVSAYCAAKHAVVGLTRSLAVELARTGVTANAICPGYTDTRMLDSSIAEICRKTGSSIEEVRSTLAGRNPQGRFVQPSEVASVVRYLALMAPPSVTGLAIPVTGGEIM